MSVSETNPVPSTVLTPGPWKAHGLRCIPKDLPLLDVICCWTLGSPCCSTCQHTSPFGDRVVFLRWTGPHCAHPNPAGKHELMQHHEGPAVKNMVNAGYGGLFLQSLHLEELWDPSGDFVYSSLVGPSMYKAHETIPSIAQNNNKETEGVIHPHKRSPRVT